MAKKTVKQLAEDFARVTRWDGGAVLEFAAHALRECNFEPEAQIVDGLLEDVEAMTDGA